MIQQIASAQNDRWKHFARLYRRKYRDREKKYILEGIHLIEEALKNDTIPESVFLREGFTDQPEGEKLVKRLEVCGADILVLPKAVFDGTVNTETPQGIAAAANQPDCDVGRFFDDCETPNVVVLDRLQDPGNLGTIIRTADAAGFRHILIMKGTADIFSPKTVRAAAGSIYRVRFAYLDDPLEALRLLKQHGIKTVCTSPRADRIYFDTDIAGAAALIIGNEANGACDVFMEQADEKILLPMEGNIESLNASAAASILMYESVRQRMSKAKTGL